MKLQVRDALFCLFLILLFPSAGFPLTITYHIHAEKTAPLGFPILSAVNPDAKNTSFESDNLKGVAGPWLQSYFERFASVAPTPAGTIPAGSTVTLNVWMSKSGNYGVIYPYFKIWVYGNNDPLNGIVAPLCSVTGTSALTTTVTKYALSCATAAAQTVISTQAFRLDVGFNLTTGPGNHNMTARVYVEGALNGNYDSTVVIPQPLQSLPPAITGLSPSSGTIATPVTIGGVRFGSTQGTSSVSFAGHAASPTSWSDTSIQTTVPANTTTGSVVVTVNGVASNGVTFTVSPPNITNAAPASGNAGTPVTLTGTGFGYTQGTSTVKFAGQAATPTSWSNTSIQVPVPANATTGLVTVTVNSVASNGVTFTVTVLPPNITNISPSTGGVGSYVTLTGSGFGSSFQPPASSVTFNGALAAPAAWSDTGILVTVPGATTGPVLVTVASQTSNSVAFTVLTSGAVAGIVRRASDNAPVSGVLVKAFQSGVEKGSGTTAADGSYSLANLPQGIYDITALPTSYLPSTNSGNIVVVGQTAAADLSLVAPAISQLLPSSGPAGTSVTIRGSNFGTTQGSSTLKFNGVSATPINWADSIITAAVPSGATSGVVVVAESGIDSNGVAFGIGTGGFNGTVIQASTGAPIAGALVEMMQANVVKTSTATVPGGGYSVANLNPGTYDLRFSSSGMGTILSIGSEVAAGGNVTVNAALPYPGGISGRVTKADGTTGIAGATVTILSGAVAAAVMTTDSLGNYSSPLLAAGTYDMTAAASGYTAQTNSGIVVTAGNYATSNIRLTGQSVITYTYDNLGRLKTVSDSLGGSATYSYDAVGNLLSITNP